MIGSAISKSGMKNVAISPSPPTIIGITSNRTAMSMQYNTHLSRDGLFLFSMVVSYLIKFQVVCVLNSYQNHES